MASEPSSLPLINTLPNEILYKILEGVVGEDGIKMDAMSGQPMNSDSDSKSWTDSVLYAISVICRRWREVGSNLPAWQRIAVEVDFKSEYKGRRDYRGDFARALVELAVELRRKLEVTVEVWDNPEVGMMQRNLLADLTSSGVEWSSFHFVSWDGSSLGLLFGILERAHRQAIRWEKFELEVSNSGGIDEGSIQRIPDDIHHMVRLEGLKITLHISMDDNWRWVVPRVPSAMLSPSGSTSVRELDVSACPSMCLGLLKACHNISTSRLQFSYRDHRDMGVDWDGWAVLKLERLSSLSIFVGRAVECGRFFSNIICPKLRRFDLEWHSSREGEGLFLVEGFLKTIKRDLAGGFWIKGSRMSEVIFLERKGLERWYLPRGECETCID
ncbi:hypothetical protein PM082_013800 [Marasmius tenuissimus]|nr:hypothetical protein PM082_013800 [Marasmius tenuissimus]